MFPDFEIQVASLVTHNGKSFQVDLTNILSDRAFEEIIDLIEEKLLNKESENEEQESNLS